MIYCNSYDEAKLEAIHIISDYDNCVKAIRIGFDKKMGWYVEYEEFEMAERKELYI
jgi:hypothetical protein